MAKASNHFILILCGGTGPRLWPLSHANYPKQFLKLFSRNSLLQETVNRFKKFIPSSNIFVISNQKYISDLKKQISKSLPSKNIITEPEKKNTTMAILYGSAVINTINPNAIITATPSDHFIKKQKLFQKDLSIVKNIASITDTIVTIGIKPNFPNPAFGYILTGNKTAKYYPVNKFIEKPNIVDAQILIKKNAFWNSGLYTFSLKTLTSQLALHQKSFLVLYTKLLESVNKPQTIIKLYKLSDNIPFDKSISEKSNKLSMVPSSFEWSDVGEWQSIFNQLIKDKNNIAKINKNCIYVSTNSKNCLINSSNKKLIGLLGVNNLAIIDTQDSLLVCNLNDSYQVKDLISQIVTSQKLKNYFLKTNEKK